MLGVRLELVLVLFALNFLLARIVTVVFDVFGDEAPLAESPGQRPGSALLLLIVLLSGIYLGYYVRRHNEERARALVHYYVYHRDHLAAQYVRHPPIRSHLR